MGGSDWWQTGPYQEDLAAAFREAQDRELAEDNHGFEGRTIDRLWSDEDWQEFILTGGTATVLDQVTVVDPGHTEHGPFMRPLTPDEIAVWCPDGRPTQAQWVAAWSPSTCRSRSARPATAPCSTATGSPR
ncbi:hypothetical protein [Kitasatospora acidiphila]|uniref:hypothetical protein n=1 Tax=Kitasatospora acidiphila TaxID=2567942 RepID=UPI001E2D4865|nr:hypothetical protein [Kitasatospora acidiphila]